jgi:hypothetical protein
MQPTIFKGIWWLPESPDDTIVGTLTFEKTDRVRLDAIGLFGNPMSSRERSGFYPIVYGRTTDSKDITLCRCIQTQSVWGTGVSTIELSAELAFVGAHLESLEGASFARAYVALEHLPKWSGVSGLKQVITFNPGGEGIARLAHEFSFPDAHPTSVGDWELRFVAAGRTQLDLHARAVIEQTVSVQLDFSKPIGFEELIDQRVRHIENLLALAVGRPTSILELTVVCAGADASREQLQVLLPQSAARVTTRVVDAGKMVFTFADIAPQWPEPLRRLVAARDHLSSTMELYFAVVNSPGLYVEVQFLNLAQAIESLHRGKGSKGLLVEERFLEVRAKIEEALKAPELGLSKGPREILCQRMKYWNEVSLRSRVKDILSDLRPTAHQVVGATSAFANRVVDTRNYLTHRDPTLRHVVEDIPALIRLTRQLRFVVEQSLLRDIGLPDALLDRHAKRALSAAAMRIAR